MRHLGIVLCMLSAGCGKVSIELEGKTCPCPSDRGVTCDPICNICVADGTAPGAVCAGSGGSDGGGCTPKIVFTDFRAEWVTANSIYWAWQPDSDDKKPFFQSYRLELTPKVPAGPSKTYNFSTNPELGLFVLPNEGADLTASTLVTDLEPQTQYTGRFVLRDTAGCEFAAESDAPVTHAPTATTPVEIFGESGFTGDTLGGSLSNTGCHIGTSCVQTSGCQVPPDGSIKCCDNVRVYGFNINAVVSSGQFEQAYLEFYARNDSSFPIYYSNLWLRIGDPAGGENRYGLDGWTFPSTGEYRRMQFPLRALVRPSDGQKLTADTLAANDIREFNWFTCLGTGASAWFDEVYIRW